MLFSIRSILEKNKWKNIKWKIERTLNGREEKKFNYTPTQINNCCYYF